MMNNKIKLLLAFVGGMVSGATAMHLYFKSQFEMVEDITEDESDTKEETKEEKKEEKKEESVKQVDPDSKEVNELVNEYNELVKKHGYKPLEPVAESKMKEKAEEDGHEQF